MKKSNVGVSSDKQVVPVALLLGTPEHGGELETEDVVLRLPWAPSVKAEKWVVMTRTTARKICGTYYLALPTATLASEAALFSLFQEIPNFPPPLGGAGVGEGAALVVGDGAAVDDGGGGGGGAAEEVGAAPTDTPTETETLMSALAVGGRCLQRPLVARLLFAMAS